VHNKSMAGQRIDIMDLRLLIQLKSKGMSNRRVAEALGVSRKTVNTYVRTFSENQISNLLQVRKVRFFKTLKAELSMEQPFENYKHARQVIFEFIEIWHHRKWLHSALDYRTPAEMEEQGV